MSILQQVVQQIPSCLYKASAGMTVSASALALAARGMWLAASGRKWGLGSPLSSGWRVARPSGFAPAASSALTVAGLVSIAVSRGVYIAGNPGGPAPEAAFIALSAAMAVGLAALCIPLVTGREYSGRASWILLAGLAGFLLFFTTVNLPCGTGAAAWVFVGIGLAFAGVSARLWRAMGEGRPEGRKGGIG